MHKRIPFLRSLLKSALLASLLTVSAQVSAMPVISEVAWMGSQSSSSDEWIEIHNPDLTAVDLANFELFQGTSVRPLPSFNLEPGAFVVVERRDQATSIGAAGAVSMSFGSGLTNSGQVLRLCPLGQSANPLVCDVANEGGAWPAGENAARQTMVRRTPFLPVVFATYEGPDSTITDSGALAIKGTPGELVEPVPGLDAGPDPDAGNVGGDVAPFSYPGLAITEVYFNPPTNAESGKEWVEISNLSSRAIAIDGAVLERIEGVQTPTVARSATLLSNRVLSPGDRIVVAGSRDLGVEACAGDDVIVVGSENFSLANSGTQLLRLTLAGVVNEIRYSGGGAPSIREGYSLALVSDDDDNSQSSNLAEGECEFATGVFGSPGVQNETCAQQGPRVCEGLPDAGVPQDDAGVPLGPNDPPTIELSAPSNDNAATPVDITWEASDSDEGDIVEVSLFYDDDGDGNDGVLITRGLAPSGTFSWDPASSVPAGTFSILGVATDRRGARAFSYAPGTVTFGGGTEQASIRVTNPDGVNDLDARGNVLIEWEVDVPDPSGASIRLFFDDDAEGFDGEPIAAGLPLVQSDGTDAIPAFLWDTTGVEQGNYAVYAVLDWSGGSEQAYGEFVSIEGEGDCSSVGTSTTWAFGLVAFLLFFGQRSRSRRISRRRE